MPPVLVGRYLAVAENDGVNDSLLKILDGPAQGSPGKLVQACGSRARPHEAAGRRPAAAGGHRRRRPHAAGVTGSEKGEPMAEIADAWWRTGRRKWSAKVIDRGPAVGGRQPAPQCDIPRHGAAPAALDRRLGSVSLQPPMAGGEAVVHIRHRQGMPGVTISAVDVEQRARWETTLAAPLAAAPDRRRPRGPAGSGRPPGPCSNCPPRPSPAMTDRSAGGALATAEMKEPIAAALPIGKGMIAMVPAGDPLDIRFPAGRRRQVGRQFRRILLTDPLSGPAAAFAGGVLAPCSSGQVCLMSPLTGAKMAEPFQPPLGPGQTFRWSAPVLVGDAEFLIANDRGGVYRVAVKDQPARHLALAAEAAIADPIVSPIAVLGNKAYAVDAADSLLAFAFPGWPRSRRAPGGCVYGPLAAGEC